ncbi:hypothetical protein Tco_1562216 [Tanacetum coccineum]
MINTSSTPVSTASANNSTACISDATVYAYLATQPNGSQVVHEDLEQIHEVDLDEMDLKWQLALRGIAIKRVLASVEEQLVFYKKNKSMFCDQIVVLKRDASFNESDINALKKHVERLRKEKEDNQFKIDNFENASKSLDQLIGNQISDNNKKGLGYNVPEFEGYGVTSENISKEVKKTSNSPIIEYWVFDCDEDETVVLESLNVQKPKQADQPRKGQSDELVKEFHPIRFIAGSYAKNYKSMIHLSQKKVQRRIMSEDLPQPSRQQSKESHAQTLTMLMKKVKRLEDKLKL